MPRARGPGRVARVQALRNASARADVGGQGAKGGHFLHRGGHRRAATHLQLVPRLRRHQRLKMRSVVKRELGLARDGAHGGDGLGGVGAAQRFRAEEERVLFGFWRGQRLRLIEPRLKPGGKFEMATLEITRGTTIDAFTARRLAAKAVALNKTLGDPTKTAARD